MSSLVVPDGIADTGSDGGDGADGADGAEDDDAPVTGIAGGGRARGGMFIFKK